jgi:hypothetical protein
MTAWTSTTDALDAWREVIALLVEAAESGYRDAVADPAVHSTALAADLLASAAIAVLPSDLDSQLDDVTLPDTPTRGMAGLIGAARAATGRYRVEAFPDGAAATIAALSDLAAEAGA